MSTMIVKALIMLSMAAGIILMVKIERRIRIEERNRNRKER